MFQSIKLHRIFFFFIKFLHSLLRDILKKFIFIFRNFSIFKFCVKPKSKALFAAYSTPRFVYNR